jgi:glycosyltransferase involved in cell wall biosynthesis
LDTLLPRGVEKELSMKKVVFVLNSAWQAYNFRLNLANYLKQSNYEIIFVAPRDGYYSDLIEKEFDFVDIELQADGVNPVQEIKLFFSLFSIFRRIKPDVILNFTIKPNIYSSIAGRMLGIQSINNISGLGTVFIKKNFLTQVIKNLYRLSLSCASKVFFQNKDDLNLFLNNNLVSSSKCSLLPGSGVDTYKFSPTASKNHDVFRFLMVSRLLRDKGIYEFIEAAKILKDKGIEFWVLGESSSANRTALSIDEITKISNQRVVTFFEKTDDVKSYLDRVDCVVLPSYREGCPRSIMEASSASLPVIVSDVPGCRQVVDNTITGFYCKVRDARDLAKKMELVFKMTKKERLEMGQMGRQKMLDQFDELIVMERYAKTITDLLNNINS